MTRVTVMGRPMSFSTVARVSPTQYWVESASFLRGLTALVELEAAVDCVVQARALKAGIFGTMLSIWAGACQFGSRAEQEERRAERWLR